MDAKIDLVALIEGITSREFQQSLIEQLTIAIKYHQLEGYRHRYPSPAVKDIDQLTSLQALDNTIKLNIYQKHYSLTELIQQLTKEAQISLNNNLLGPNAVLQVIAQLRQQNAVLRQVFIHWEEELASKISIAKQSWWTYARWRLIQAANALGNLGLGGIANLYIRQQATSTTGIIEGVALTVAVGTYVMFPRFYDDTEETQDTWLNIAWQSAALLATALTYYGTRRTMQALVPRLPSLGRIDLRWHLGTGLSLGILYASGISYTGLLIPASYMLATQLKQQQEYSALNHLQADLTPCHYLRYIQPTTMIIGIRVIQGAYQTWCIQTMLPLCQTIGFLIGIYGAPYVAIRLFLEPNELHQADTQFFLYLLATASGEQLAFLTTQAYQCYLQGNRYAQVTHALTESLANDQYVTNYTITATPSAWSPRFWLGIDKPIVNAAWTRRDGLLHQASCTIESINTRTNDAMLACEYKKEIPALMP